MKHMGADWVIAQLTRADVSKVESKEQLWPLDFTVNLLILNFYSKPKICCLTKLYLFSEPKYKCLPNPRNNLWLPLNIFQNVTLNEKRIKTLESNMLNI